jgi:hypothetical protein
VTTAIRVALALVAFATVITLSCLVKTTALSMTFFFAAGIPLYGLAALIYIVEVIRDLRHHQVL